jgi:hypothetical protein
MSPESRVVAFAPDLMDRSKVLAAARAAGATVEVLTTPSALPGAIDDGVLLALVDLSRLDDLGVLSACRGIPTVGFGSHVDHQLLRAAADAGCSEVLPRSAFFRRLPSLVNRVMTPDPPAEDREQDR